MTIQDLGSIGELVAAIATIATLVYLAIQIRQNTFATERYRWRLAMSSWLEIVQEAYADHQAGAFPAFSRKVCPRSCVPA